MRAAQPSLLPRKITLWVQISVHYCRCLDVYAHTNFFPAQSLHFIEVLHAAPSDAMGCVSRVNINFLCSLGKRMMDTLCI